MKIAVLASGGVDSSVALKLLKEQGHEVHAFYLKIWLEDELQHLNECPWEEDLAFVREICGRENIPLTVVPMQQEYFDKVVGYTISEVKEGRTPNPDIMCNSSIKFGIFLNKIASDYKDIFDKVASGHYAVEYNKNGAYYLKTSPDKVKDQTYFLANLNQDQLKKLTFPIGNLTKEEVRGLADKYDLPNKNRKDSQGICFLGKFKYNDFIKHYLGEKEGDLIEFETGKKVGTHKGFWYYTVGQRKGIHLPNGPYYIVKKDPASNKVYVSRTYFSEEKSRNSFEITNLNFFEGVPPNPLASKETLTVKLRHGETRHDVLELKPSSEGPIVEKLFVKIAQTDQGIAPGQFAVFYNDEICLGCGVIC